MFKPFLVLFVFVAVAHGVRVLNLRKQAAPYHGPELLRNLTVEQRIKFENVKNNENLTIAQIESVEESLAEEYGILDAYNAKRANKTASVSAFEANVTAFIIGLETVKERVLAILRNKNQTIEARDQALTALKLWRPREAHILSGIGRTVHPNVEVIPMEFEHHRHHGHRVHRRRYYY